MEGKTENEKRCKTDRKSVKIGKKQGEMEKDLPPNRCPAAPPPPRTPVSTPPAFLESRLPLRPPPGRRTLAPPSVAPAPMYRKAEVRTIGLSVRLGLTPSPESNTFSSSIAAFRC